MVPRVVVFSTCPFFVLPVPFCTGERFVRRESEDLGRCHGKVPADDGVALGAGDGGRVQRRRDGCCLGKRGRPDVSRCCLFSPCR